MKEDRHDIKGSLFEEDEQIGETPFIEVDEDGMNAYLIVPKKPLATDIRMLLSELSISFGVDTDLVEEINKLLYDKLKLEEKYHIAKGRKAVNGQPGELILRTKAPEEVILSSEDLTQVDYKTYKRKMLAMGEKEKPAAMIIQPTKGHDGMDIFGNAIPGTDGEEVEINLGENVYLSGRKIISKLDGLIEYKKHKNGIVDFDVSEVYYVKGDVDYSTGNIDFPGSVIIKGIIKAGFEVYAKNEVIAETIRGNVYTNGSVVAKQGIIGGTHKATIHAGGSVNAKFMQYAKVVSGDSVEIKKSIVTSEIYAENSIIVESSPGTIIGGNLFAVNRIEAKVLGSESYVKTEVALYQSAKDVILLRDIIASRFRISKDLSRIETYLGGDKKLLFAGMEGDKKNLLNKLLTKRESLRRELLEKNSELKSMQKMMTKPIDGRIIASKEVWPEVRVSIAGKFILLKDERGKSEFYYNKDEEMIDYK